MNSIFIRGIYTPNVVPLNPDHRINEGELRRYTSWLIDKGISGLYPNGSTGEFIRLSFEERIRVVEIMAGENRGRVPILPRDAAHKCQHGAPRRWQDSPEEWQARDGQLLSG